MTGSDGIATSVGFELLGSRLGTDVRSALKTALSAGAVFSTGDSALALFQRALAESIRDIESHPRGKLFQEFLSKGPYEDVGRIPSTLVEHRLSDAETAAVTAFIYSHMVNCFKGAIAELLAARAVVNLLERLRADSVVPPQARLYVGDAVGIHRARGRGLLKGADQHILVVGAGHAGTPHVTVVGVTEVKSYVRSSALMSAQIDRHIRRVKRGITVEGVAYWPTNVQIGGRRAVVVRIAVVPADWKLPRTYRFERGKRGRIFVPDETGPPQFEDIVEQTGRNDWRVRLRWSKEALAEAAYEMTFWYMGKVGESLYATALPKGWESMTPSDAGQNAAKMMLNFAILRARSEREEQRAIGLYNSYCFGYAVGMNFRNNSGRREILCPQDLDEIAMAGKTQKEDTLC